MDPYRKERAAQHAARKRWQALDWPHIYPKHDCPEWAEISAKAAPLLCPVCHDDDHMYSDDDGVWTCRSCGTEFVTPRWIRWMETQVS